MNRVQTLRSSITGDRPIAGTRQPGELYVNWADQTLGTIDPAKTAMDLVAVRFFSTLANYTGGSHVIYNGNLYRALGAITAGPFDPTEWGAIVVGGGVPEAPFDGLLYARSDGDWSAIDGLYLPITGGTLTGDLTIAEPTGNSSLIISKAASGLLAQFEGRHGANLRWDVTVGDQTAETGANAGSDFSINAFADGAVDGSAPLSVALFIKRSTGQVSVAMDPTIPLGVATKAYVDAHSGSGGGIPEPTGGLLYGRKVVTGVGQWAATTPEAPTDGQLYGRRSAAWAVVSTGGGGIPDAPNDGQQYGRQSLGWTVVATGSGIPDAPNDGQQYGRQSHGWTVVATGGGGIPDAPNDGTAYARKSLGWSHLTHTDITDWTTTLAGYLPLTGGTVTGDLTVAEPSGNSSILIQKASSGNLAQLEGWKGSNIRWDMTLGDQTAETGSNAGSDFSLNSFADGAVNGSAPLHTAIFVSRSTGYVSFPAGDPLTPTGAATKHYVDIAVASAGGGLNPNLLDNGDMSVFERNSGTLAVTSGTHWLVDRWAAVATQSRFTMGQNFNGLTPPAGFARFLGAQCTSATAAGSTDFFAFQQGIEGATLNGFNWGSASAQSMTLSFWACSDQTGTFSGALNNAASTRAFVFTFALVANTPAHFTITIPGDSLVGAAWINTGQALAMWLLFNLGSGASQLTSTVGSWVAGNFIGATGSAGIIGHNGAKFYVTGVKLEPGSAATPYAYDPPAVRQVRCARYFQILGQVNCAQGYNNNGAFATMSTSYICEMRSGAPAASFSNITYNNANSLQMLGVSNNVIITGANLTGTGASFVTADVTLSAEI